MTDLPQLYEPLRRAWIARGWPWLGDPRQINLLGIRAASDQADVWDDWICVAHLDVLRRPHLEVFEATTDPGRVQIEDPDHPGGVAVVCPGYYADLWRRGMHRGAYEDLSQAGLVDVWRGRGRLPRGGPVYRDARGIDLHHAADTVRGVGPWSAGCQVVRSRRSLARILVLEADHRAAGGRELHGYGLVDLGDEPWLAALPWPGAVRGMPVLERGDLGPDVAEVQRLLVLRGERLGVDSKFGGDTEAAVRRLQVARGLEVDGVVGPVTWGALRAA